MWPVRPLPALLLCLLAAPGAAEVPRAVAEPRLTGELRFGVGRMPDSGTGASSLTAIAGGRIELGLAVQPDSGPRLDFVVEIEAAGPSGMRFRPRRD